jgi:hypothetical protein
MSNTPYRVEDVNAELIMVVGPNNYRKLYGTITVGVEMAKKFANEHASEMNTAYNAGREDPRGRTHTKPPFRVGPARTPNPRMVCIVADDATGLDESTGALDKEYYGGNLIAESVSPGNAQFIVDACNFYWRILTETLKKVPVLTVRHIVDKAGLPLCGWITTPVLANWPPGHRIAKPDEANCTLCRKLSVTPTPEVTSALNAFDGGVKFSVRYHGGLLKTVTGMKSGPPGMLQVQYERRPEWHMIDVKDLQRQ